MKRNVGYTFFHLPLPLFILFHLFFYIFFFCFFFRHASTAAYLFELHICNVCGRIDNEVDVNVAEWSCVGRSASGWPSFRFLSPFWPGFFFVIFLWKLYDLQPAADLSHVCPLIYGTSCSSINLTHIRLDPIAAGQGTYSIKRHVTLPAQCNCTRIPTKLVSYSCHFCGYRTFDTMKRMRQCWKGQ